MEKLEELIKKDLEIRTWKNLIDKLDLSKQPQSRIYFLGELFGVLLYENEKGSGFGFTVIEQFTADIPGSWGLSRTISIDPYWIEDLREQLERAKKWIKKHNY